MDIPDDCIKSAVCLNYILHDCPGDEFGLDKWRGNGLDCFLDSRGGDLLNRNEFDCVLMVIIVGESLDR